MKLRFGKTVKRAPEKDPKYVRDLACFKESMGTPRFALRPEDQMPILGEDTKSTEFDRHYVYHTAWAVRKLAETRPALHVDIGSFLYFAALGSAVFPMRFYDYRPAKIILSGLETGHADLLGLSMDDGSVESLSCMHVVEHVGLGRYGDPIDYDGDLKAMAELQRVLQPGGNLFFVVPTGREAAIHFNAHRIYSYNQVVASFPKCSLKEFSFIEGLGNNPILENHDPSMIEDSYGCGCYWFVKKS